MRLVNFFPSSLLILLISYIAWLSIKTLAGVVYWLMLLIG
jgi:hypothetical protein